MKKGTSKRNVEITLKQIKEIYKQVDKEREKALLEVKRTFDGLDERDKQLVIAANIGVIETPERLFPRVENYKRIIAELHGLVTREAVSPIDNELEAERILLEQPWWSNFIRKLKEKWSIYSEKDIGSWGTRHKKLQPYIYDFGYYYQTWADYIKSGPFKPTMGVAHIGPRKLISWRIDIKSSEVVPITLPVSNQLEKGLILASTGRNEEAVIEFKRYIKIKSDDAIAYIVRGDSFDDMGQIKSAIDDYSRSIELEPDLPEAYDKRATAYAELGDFEKALQDGSRAAEIHPERAYYHYNLALFYDGLGDIQNTINCSTKAIELDKDYAKAYYNRGIAYNEIEEYDKAISDFNNTISLKPDFIQDVYFNRGVAYQGKGESNKALADYKRVLNLISNPEDIEVVKNKIRELTSYHKHL